MSVLSMTSFALFSRQGRGLGSDLGGFLTDVRSVLGWRMPALLLLMVIVAVGEGASMALLLPLLSAVGMAGVGAGAGQLQVLVSHVSEFFLGQDPQIQSVLMLVVGVFFLQGILCSFGQQKRRAFSHCICPMRVRKMLVSLKSWNHMPM